MTPLIACIHCGTVLVLERVASSPHKVCPVCQAPLEEAALMAMSFESADKVNPEAGRAEARQSARAQMETTLAPVGNLVEE